MPPDKIMMGLRDRRMSTSLQSLLKASAREVKKNATVLMKLPTLSPMPSWIMLTSLKKKTDNFLNFICLPTIQYGKGHYRLLVVTE